MKTYKIYHGNKVVMTHYLNKAIELAIDYSITGFRASIFEDGKKIATYEYGKEKVLA